jgi:nucleotide-binding universal stress UspA family protein
MSSEDRVQKVMVAVDGSPPSQNALKYAIFTASKFGAKLVVFCVVEQEKVGYWQFIDEHFKKELLNKARQVITQAETLAAERGLSFQSELVEGAQPYQEIVDYVEKNPGITTLVMGDHGMGLTDRHLLGSTTERVIRLIAKKALPVAVTVVPYVAPDSPACDLFAGPLCT